MKITEETGAHLAKLAKIYCWKEEQDALMWSLETIIDFLAELPDAPDTEQATGKNEMHGQELHCFTEQEAFQDPQKLLRNSIHFKENTIQVKTSLSEG